MKKGLGIRVVEETIYKDGMVYTTRFSYYTLRATIYNAIHKSIEEMKTLKRSSPKKEMNKNKIIKFWIVMALLGYEL